MTSRTACLKIAACLVLSLAITGSANATEGKASVYPAGVETILPGQLPASRATTCMNFNNFYVANGVAGPTGLPFVAGYHLRVSAIAFKCAHNWGVPLLGGRLASQVAVPIIDTHLDLLTGSHNKVGLGNPNIETTIAYRTKSLLGWYGLEVYTPGPFYTKTDVVNIGQHNFAIAPAAAFSYLPRRGTTALSSKFQYIINYANNSTQYHSGNEFLWEYSGLQAIGRKVMVGGNGFFYQQITGDTVAGTLFKAGLQSRNLAIGPEVRYHFKHCFATMKWEKDLFTENRSRGDSFWLQIAVPLSHAKS